jgi:3-mercaptopyruvate sulfurtransferase SseA
MLERDSHQFKSADEIRNILAGLGITPDKTVYTY